MPTRTPLPARLPGLIRNLAALLVSLWLWTAESGAACRQALVLALDVSGSVDSREYRLQLDGLAAALSNPQVRAALLAMPQAPVDMAIFEWSAPTYQRQLLPWTSITDAATLTPIITRLRSTTRQNAPPGTAIGTAMQTGAALLSGRDTCWKRTLDISGDGKHNNGPHPRDLRSAMEAQGVVVNALTIGVGTARIGDRRQAEIAELQSYFRAYVIAGPGAFVETALGFEDYEAAMVRKLIRELEGLSIARADQ